MLLSHFQQQHSSGGLRSFQSNGPTASAAATAAALSQSFEHRQAQPVGDQLHASSAPRGVVVVFNELVPTICNVHNREDMNRPLGILVATTIGGPTGHSNIIRVRLTDPTDPFFLFQLELVEDDYGRFKKDHQMHVDFHEFAADLADMLHEIVLQQSLGGAALTSTDTRPTTERRLLFSVISHAASTAQLFVQERTRVKTTNMLELQLNREGDVGQKHYLAEQFEHFQASYYDADSQVRDQGATQEGTINELRVALSLLQKEKDDAEGKLKVAASKSESLHQRALLERQDEHNNEVKALRIAADDERAALTTKLDALTLQLRDTIARKDADVGSLQQRINELEQSEATLKGQLGIKTLELDAKVSEVQLLSSQVSQLSDHRSRSEHSLNETKLLSVQFTERLAAAERQVAERAEETRVSRQQAINDAETIRVLTDQVKERAAKAAEIEGDLKKAHHIISNQLQSSKQQKEKFANVVQQLQDTRFLLDQQQHKNVEVEKSLVDNQTEQRALHHQITQLKEELHSMLDANSRLEQDLKLARDAVISVQRHGVHQRNFSSTSAAQDVYRHATIASALPTGLPQPSTSIASGTYGKPFGGAGISSSETTTYVAATSSVSNLGLAGGAAQTVRPYTTSAYYNPSHTIKQPLQPEVSAASSYFS